VVRGVVDNFACGPSVAGYLELLSKWSSVVQSLARSPGALRLSEEGGLSYVGILTRKTSEGCTPESGITSDTDDRDQVHTGHRYTDLDSESGEWA
jgi:hypothetical protein